MQNQHQKIPELDEKMLRKKKQAANQQTNTMKLKRLHDFHT